LPCTANAPVLGAQWIQVGQSLYGSVAGAQFEYSDAFSSGGNTLVYDTSGSQIEGRVKFITGNNWTLMGAINGWLGELSGTSVVLNDESSRVAIGANKNDTNGQDAGQVRVFFNPELGIVPDKGMVNLRIYPNPARGDIY